MFDVGATRKILQAGKAAGMSANFHGDELNAMNAAELGAELGARCVSHLEEISNQGITAMSNSGVIGVLLPTTAYILRLKPPPARKMIDEGSHFPSLYIHMCIHPPTHSSIHPPIHPPTHPFIHPPTHSSIHPPIYPPIHPFIHPPTHSSIHPPIHPPTHSSTHPPIYPPIHPFIHHFAGIAVALGSDFNPNAYCMSMVSYGANITCLLVVPKDLLLFLFSRW